MYVFLMIFLIGLALMLIGVYGFGKEEKVKGEDIFLFVVGVVLCCGALAYFYVEVSSKTSFRTSLKEMRRRLNEPIVSEAQLYGYQVIDKRYIKEKPSADKPEKSKYFIDVNDILPPASTTLKDIEISEEIYNKVKIKEPNALQEPQ